MLDLRRILSFRDRSLDEIIFLQAITICLVAMVALTINAAIHGMIYPLFVFDLSTTIILSFFFYMAGYKGKYKQFILPFVITVLALIDLSWFMSGGYRGPNGYFLLLILFISLIIVNKKQRYLYTILMVLNAITLYAFEYHNPKLATKLPLEFDMIGQCSIFVICIITVSVTVIKIKNNFESDKANIIKMNELLSEQKMEIELKNKKLEAYSDKLKTEVALQTQQLASLNSELLEQNTALEQFTYILAHNIRSPITQIKGLFSLLPEGFSKDEEILEIMTKMKNSTNKLGDVIHDLSKIVDVRKNTKEIFETVSLKRQLKLAINTLDDHIYASNANIDISKVEDVTIKGINAYVQSIFYNLIHNAIKYSSKDRQPEIDITVQQGAENVLINVSDNGIGIDMECAKNRIFQIYQRFNTTHQGKGFGLFLIKTQVETMGGEIEVESELGKGTTFTIRV